MNSESRPYFCRFAAGMVAIVVLVVVWHPIGAVATQDKWQPTDTSVRTKVKPEAEARDDLPALGRRLDQIEWLLWGRPNITQSVTVTQQSWQEQLMEEYRDAKRTAEPTGTDAAPAGPIE